MAGPDRLRSRRSLAADAAAALDACCDVPRRAATRAGSTPGRRPTAAAVDGHRARRSAARSSSEPRVAAELGARLPARTTLFVAASMPVRDVETFFPSRRRAAARARQPRRQRHRRDGLDRVRRRRGDGRPDGAAHRRRRARCTTSAGCSPPAAPAPDAGHRAARQRRRRDLPLPPRRGRARRTSSEHVATPHGIDFARAAALYGLAYAAPADLAAFDAALTGALARDGPRSCTCARTARRTSSLHRQVWDAVRASVRRGA